MDKKLAILVVAGMVLLGMSGLSYAMCGMCGSDHGKDAGHAHEAEAKSAGAAVDVGNKICPVMGEKIADASKATYEYKGKVYNFCCPMCIDEFKKNPEKYIEKIEKEKK